MEEIIRDNSLSLSTLNDGWMDTAELCDRGRVGGALRVRPSQKMRQSACITHPAKEIKNAKNEWKKEKSVSSSIYI